MFTWHGAGIRLGNDGMPSDGTVSVLNDQIPGMILSVQIQVPEFEVHLPNVCGRERIRRTHYQSGGRWRHFRTRILRGKSNGLQPCPSTFHYLPSGAERVRVPRARWSHLTGTQQNKQYSGAESSTVPGQNLDGSRAAAAIYVSGSCLSKVYLRKSLSMSLALTDAVLGYDRQ